MPLPLLRLRTLRPAPRRCVVPAWDCRMPARNHVANQRAGPPAPAPPRPRPAAPQAEAARYTAGGNTAHKLTMLGAIACDEAATCALRFAPASSRVPLDAGVNATDGPQSRHKATTTLRVPMATLRRHSKRTKRATTLRFRTTTLMTMVTF